MHTFGRAPDWPILGGHPGVSFLLPVFVLALVKDKEERVLIMMKMVRADAYIGHPPPALRG
jgi:hypothetical protein